MINYRYIKLNLAVVLLVFIGGLTAACDDDISVGRIDEGNYQTNEKIVGYVINSDGKQSVSNIEFRNMAKTDLFLALTKNAEQAVSATFKYDKAVLDAYNLANETAYKAFPENLTSLENEGAVSIATGESKSNSLSVSLQTGESLSSDESYVIPLSVELKSGNIELKGHANYLIFAKDMSKIPDADKSSGIKIISCMEVNDTNPLNNLCFTLKDSGKPLIDIVILFSGNINYNNETGRVYNYNNPNVQHILDNRERYLKPLQDRGIKVVLGILGNHDRSGVANLSKTTAQEFAKEMKAVSEAYKLDGFFFDDEYSKYESPVPPGFVSPSNDAAARLFYEAKKIMPDKLMCAYVYGRTNSFPKPVDGVNAGEFVDWGIHDYGGSSDLSNSYPGLAKSGMALYSQEFARGYFTTETSLRNMRTNGYGGHMIFAMDPFRANFTSRQLPAMQLIAKTLFDEDVVYTGSPYKKDW